MSEEWIAEETATAKFEDKRLNDRFAAILTAFGDRPNASIPAALNGHTEPKRPARRRNHLERPATYPRFRSRMEFIRTRSYQVTYVVQRALTLRLAAAIDK